MGMFDKIEINDGGDFQHYINNALAPVPTDINTLKRVLTRMGIIDNPISDVSTVTFGDIFARMERSFDITNTVIAVTAKALDEK